MTTYTHILDLAKDAEPPADGILSRTVFQDAQIKAVVGWIGGVAVFDRPLNEVELEKLAAIRSAPPVLQPPSK